MACLKAKHAATIENEATGFINKAVPEDGPLCLVPICNDEIAFCRRIRAVWLRGEEEHGQVWPGDTSKVQPESGDVTRRPVLQWQRQTFTSTSKTVFLTFRALSVRNRKVNYLKQEFKFCTPWHNSLYRLDQGTFYFQNVTKFRRTQANVISCTPQEQYGLPNANYARHSQMLDSSMCRLCTELHQTWTVNVERTNRN